MRLFSYLALTGLFLVLAGCSTAPQTARVAAPAPVFVPPPAHIQTNVPSRLSPEMADDIAIHALGLVGTPYRYGGNTPDGGFDCSGLIGYVYRARVSVAPPRTVAQLSAWGRPIPSDIVRTGDLVLFGKSSTPTHAGIYVGKGRFVHAPSTGGEVRLDHLQSRYWAAQKVAFLRP